MSRATPKILLIETGPAGAPLPALSGFELVCAPNLAAGLEKINSHSYDLVLVDLNFSDGQGLNVFSQIQGTAQPTPVVVLAGEAEEEIAARTLSLGAQDYVLKSQLTAQSLGRVIRKTLDRHYCELTHNHEGFLLQTLMNSIPGLGLFQGYAQPVPDDQPVPGQAASLGRSAAGGGQKRRGLFHAAACGTGAGG